MMMQLSIHAVPRCMRPFGLALFIALGLGIALPLSAQTSKPGRPVRPGSTRSVMQQVIERLTEQAIEAKKTGEIPDEPTIAAEIEESGAKVDEVDVLRAMVRRQHRDPFVDAYIRWQLTGFDVTLPEISDRDFITFMDNAPAFVENPAADPRIVSFFEQAERAGAHAPDRVEFIRRAQAEMETKQREAVRLNEPATKYREWVAEQLGETGVRPRQWMMEELAAKIAAGWPVSDIKGAMSRAYSDSVNDETFTPEQRAMLVNQLKTIIGPGRRWVKEITYLASGEVKVAVWTSSVDMGDVENWTNRLAGRDR